jgi:molecular chaperone HtpG
MTEGAPQSQADAAGEELVYAAAVLILSEDLYPKKLEIVREYIQNASDALDDYRRIAEFLDDRSEPQIKISIQGRSLLVFDTGTGMDIEEMRKLKRIAYSEKRLGEEAGYKGIGRLAGIAVADKLKSSSTSYGDAKLYHFEFRAAEMRHDVSSKKSLGFQEPASQVITRHTSLWDTDVDVESHYTMVELRDIRESCLDILEVNKLKEYIADIAPVDFPPDSDFAYASLISSELRKNLPDYSPKAVFFATSPGERARIYKPYTNAMMLARPEFVAVRDPNNTRDILAYCWYASKGREILGKVRPVGKIFSVDGAKPEERYRLAGLIYKLFGFSVGDRSLPQRTLWTTTPQRAQWFTGEIHIVNKAVLPTTDRSNFVENDARETLYKRAAEAISNDLNRKAQQISDNRQAFDKALQIEKKLQEYRRRLASGRLDRRDVKPAREEIAKCLAELKRRGGKGVDQDVLDLHKDIRKLGEDVSESLFNPKLFHNPESAVADIATELHMTSKTRKVFEIIMETLQKHYGSDKDQYYEVADKIYSALRKRY